MDDAEEEEEAKKQAKKSRKRSENRQKSDLLLKLRLKSESIQFEVKLRRF